MFKILKLLYKALKEKIYFCLDLVNAKVKKGSNFSINLLINSLIERVDGFTWPSPVRNDHDKLVATNLLVRKELDKYLKSLKPSMPLLNYDPAIKTMKIEWNTTVSPINENAQIKERLEEQIINKYVRYVSRYIFVLLQPNKHKVLLNVTACEPLGNYQIPIGEQILYKDPLQLESYLMDHLMGMLVSYQANGIEDFTYFISHIDKKQYEELSIKIQALF